MKKIFDLVEPAVLDFGWAMKNWALAMLTAFTIYFFIGSMFLYVMTSLVGWEFEGLHVAYYESVADFYMWPNLVPLWYAMLLNYSLWGAAISGSVYWLVKVFTVKSPYKLKHEYKSKSREKTHLQKRP